MISEQNSPHIHTYVLFEIFRISKLSNGLQFIKHYKRTHIYNWSIVSKDHILKEPSKEDVRRIDEVSGCSTKDVTARECPLNVCTKPPVRLHTFTTLVETIYLPNLQHC